MKKYNEILNSFEFFKNYSFIHGTTAVAMVVCTAAALVSALISRKTDFIIAADAIAALYSVLTCSYGFRTYLYIPSESDTGWGYMSEILPLRHSDVLRYWNTVYLKNVLMLTVAYILQIIVYMRKSEIKSLIICASLCILAMTADIIFLNIRFRKKH